MTMYGLVATLHLRNSGVNDYILPTDTSLVGASSGEKP
jgi:hypothetical protein